MRLEQKLPESLQFEYEIEQLHKIMHEERHRGADLTPVYHMCIEDISKRYGYKEEMVDLFYKAYDKK